PIAGHIKNERENLLIHRFTFAVISILTKFYVVILWIISLRNSYTLCDCFFNF
ncbi:hypothetical protein L9F63_025754, partial [Diploptera punctata]